ncbi:hypothetical protein SISNIDRAFT_470622 [Sistotremastrum niveocremeum HHB9708]|uniref:Uncharacterized protein n=1 Tax=Sistotremastrum niveocremeum HHB9708 TaxID=1314777 RepID=A0A164NNH4_9AGAM|nr:hypothetical protein SISNIDRAFT_470622 [Sistotremastrum niveocremeum HHB9708]
MSNGNAHSYYPNGWNDNFNGQSNGFPHAADPNFMSYGQTYGNAVPDPLFIVNNSVANEEPNSMTGAQQSQRNAEKACRKRRTDAHSYLRATLGEGPHVVPKVKADVDISAAEAIRRSANMVWVIWQSRPKLQIGVTMAWKTDVREWIGVFVAGGLHAWNNVLMTTQQEKSQKVQRLTVVSRVGLEGKDGLEFATKKLEERESIRWHRSNSYRQSQPRHCVGYLCNEPALFRIIQVLKILSGPSAAITGLLALTRDLVLPDVLKLAFSARTKSRQRKTG